MTKRNDTQSKLSIPNYDQILYPTTIMYCTTKIEMKKKRGEPLEILIMSRLQTRVGAKFYFPQEFASNFNSWKHSSLRQILLEELSH